MMIACGDFVIPGNKVPPNNAEAEAAYAIFIDMIENGWLTVSSESLVDGKTRIRWELLKEHEAVPVIQREVMHMLVWCCGSCGVAITDGDKFCRNCGKQVKWNDEHSKT